MYVEVLITELERKALLTAAQEVLDKEDEYVDEFIAVLYSARAKLGAARPEWPAGMRRVDS